MVNKILIFLLLFSSGCVIKGSTSGGIKYKMPEDSAEVYVSFNVETINARY
jgi:hypothetical protein